MLLPAARLGELEPEELVDARDDVVPAVRDDEDPDDDDDPDEDEGRDDDEPDDVEAGGGELGVDAAAGFWMAGLAGAAASGAGSGFGPPAARLTEAAQSATIHTCRTRPTMRGAVPPDVPSISPFTPPIAPRSGVYRGSRCDS